MRRVSVKQLVPGMITAEDVFSQQNQVLIPKGTKLTDSNITVLAMFQISSVKVEDEITDTKVDLTWQPMSVRIKRTPEFKKFKKDYDQEVDTVKDSLIHSVEQDLPLDIDGLLSSTLALIDNNQNTTGIFSTLQCMREYDDLTFAHCVNVALICNILAKWLRFSTEEIRTATACGLFHDIGKLKIPIDILTKPAKLSDEEFKVMKTHPVRGYEMLRKQNAEEHICNAALMHHERCNATGYPLGLPLEKIDRFAKLVTISDVYDAMTAARVYRGPMCPFAVVEIMERDGLQNYDPVYFRPFLENVVNTYLSCKCRLSDGSEGDIIFINKHKLSRPVIQCGSKYVDLSTTPELSIDCLL